MEEQGALTQDHLAISGEQMEATWLVPVHAFAAHEYRWLAVQRGKYSHTY